MTQIELNQLVASATGESLAVIRRHGVSLADPLEVDYDPEPRRPMVLNWDTGCPAEWPGP